MPQPCSPATAGSASAPTTRPPACWCSTAPTSPKSSPNTSDGPTTATRRGSLTPSSDSSSTTRRRRRRKRLGRQHDQQQANCTSVGWSALVQWGLLSGEERGEVVEGGGPSGFGVVAAGGVGPVAERHSRLGAVVVEFHAGDGWL